MQRILILADGRSAKIFLHRLVKISNKDDIYDVVYLDKSILSMSMAGYWGYLGNSKLIIINPLQPIPYYDRPVVWRMSYAHKWKKWKMTLRLQGGINDFMYTSVQCSMSYSLPNLFRTHN